MLSVVIKVRWDNQQADRSEDIDYKMFWIALKTVGICAIATTLLKRPTLCKVENANMAMGR